MIAYQDVLGELVQRDNRLIVMTAENRAAIRGLPAMLGPRFLDTGITEQTLVGMAAGLALRGRIVVAHALAAFLTMRAFEFIRTDVGIANLPVKLVGYIPGVLSEANGPTHQALEDLALMRGIPNLTVCSPADLDDLLAMLPTVVQHPGPVYLRYNDRLAAIHHDRDFQIGRAEVISEGDDIGILTHGALFRESLEASACLRAAGYSVRLVNLRTIKPLDQLEILSTARKTPLLVTIEDHFQTGGLFSAVSELLTANGVATRVFPIAFDDRWFKPALLPDVLAVEEMQGPDLAQRVLTRLGSKRSAA
jgi:transketolase